MAWLRVDDRFPEHRKIVALRRADRFTWVELLCYCARHGSGHVPAGIADILRYVTPAFVRNCVDAGLLDRNDDGSYEVHDWQVYNPKDPGKADRQRRWRQGKRENVDADVDAQVDAGVDAPVDGDVDASRVGARARPVPTPTPRGPSAAGPVGAPDPDPADAAAIKRLDQAGWDDSQLTQAREQLDRAIAWLDHAEHDPSCHTPGALSWSKFAKGGWPPEPRGGLANGATGTRSIREQRSTDPASVCPDCGERQGHGHLETCPRMPQLAPEPEREPEPPPPAPRRRRKARAA